MLFTELRFGFQVLLQSNHSKSKISNYRGGFGVNGPAESLALLTTPSVKQLAHFGGLLSSFSPEVSFRTFLFPISLDWHIMLYCFKHRWISIWKLRTPIHVTNSHWFALELSTEIPFFHSRLTLALKQAQSSLGIVIKNVVSELWRLGGSF